jgi:hypothetical protein
MRITIQQLYTLNPESTNLHLYNFLQHIGEYFDCDLENTKIETRIVRRINFDHRRYWQLASVWFEGKPFGVIQNAGREGRDHVKAFWTDADVYGRAIQYLRDLTSLNDTLEVTSVTFNGNELLNFNGFSCDDEIPTGDDCLE